MSKLTTKLTEVITGAALTVGAAGCSSMEKIDLSGESLRNPSPNGHFVVPSSQATPSDFSLAAELFGTSDLPELNPGAGKVIGDPERGGGRKRALGFEAPRVIGEPVVSDQKTTYKWGLINVHVADTSLSHSRLGGESFLQIDMQGIDGHVEDSTTVIRADVSVRHDADRFGSEKNSEGAYYRLELPGLPALEIPTDAKISFKVSKDDKAGTGGLNLQFKYQEYGRSAETALTTVSEQLGDYPPPGKAVELALQVTRQVKDTSTERIRQVQSSSNLRTMQANLEACRRDDTAVLEALGPRETQVAYAR